MKKRFLAKRKQEEIEVSQGPLTGKELEGSRKYLIKDAQKSLHSRFKERRLQDAESFHRRWGNDPSRRTYRQGNCVVRNEASCVTVT